MREIGGYIEFETYHGKMLHEDGILLNCGRSCLAYLIEARKIEKIVMPYLMCDAVFDVCRKYGVQIRFYHIGEDLRPEEIMLQKNEWLYLMNFYGQMTIEEIKMFGEVYERVIVDFTHDYFHDPVKGMDTLYTCRKFFGVSDGAILYTDADKIELLETDESFERIHYLCGRYERTATEFYTESSQNNAFFNDEPIKRMSKLTRNLLKGIDYRMVSEKRRQNFQYLYERFGIINRLNLWIPDGAFAYPLFIKSGKKVRAQLALNRIYVPTLWPNVLEEMPEESLEHQMAENILPLPCDQRYSVSDMEYMADMIEMIMKNDNYEGK